MNSNLGKNLNEWRIEDFGCTVRLYHKLYSAGIKTVGDLVEKSEDDIKNIGNFGSKCTNELFNLLKANGLSLK